MSTIVHHLPTKLGAVKKLLGSAKRHPQDVKDAGLMGEQIISKKIRGGGNNDFWRPRNNHRVEV